MLNFKALRYIASTNTSADIQLTVADDGLEIINPSGTREKIIHEDIELMPVGYTDSQTILKVKSTGDIIISPNIKLLKTLAIRGSNDLKRQVQSRVNQLNHERISIIKNWSIVAVIFGCLVIIMLCGTMLVVDLAIAHIPPEFENQCGNLFFTNYSLSHSLADNSVQGRRIASLGESLLRHSPESSYKFYFHLENNPAFNAFAIPGGNIVVFSGLANQASDDELADVLAHEIGHVIKRHSLRRILQEAGIGGCLQILCKGRGHQVDAIVQQFFRLSSLSYSRSQEREADLVGIKIALASGYDPGALIALFKRLGKNEINNKYLNIFSTHPMTSEREEYLEKEISLLKK